MKRLLLILIACMAANYSIAMNYDPACGSNHTLEETFNANSELMELASITINREQLISEGAFGKVYATNNENWLAKVSKPGKINDWGKEAYFINKFYGEDNAFIRDDVLYMRKVPGFSINDILKQRLMQMKAPELFEQAKNAIRQGKLNDLFSELKDKGIYHGDVHAGNIFYDPVTDRFYIIDFGNSRNMDSQNEFKDRNYIEGLIKSFGKF